MSEKVALVRLRANNSQFVRSMKESADAARQVSGVKFDDMSTKLDQVGSTMTRNVTLPLVALGGVAVKFAMDFDTAFQQMVNLADVGADEVDGLKESVLALSGETAVAPQELAEALYFAASAGLSTAEAMEAVDMAARASAVGLGNTTDVVGLVASAIASYGSESMDAARATDVLMGTIRAGRADPDELAGTLGRILPVANQLGISFEEVGGTVAYLSNIFGDTNRTVTAVSGVFNKLIAPTTRGRQALEDMGTSFDELQAALDSGGLMGALDLLRKRGFAGNQQALRALFDDVEAFQGALALVNDESGTLTAAMVEVEDAAGGLAEAFGATSESEAFKMKQALNEARTALIQLGSAIAPIVADVAQFAAVVLGAFSDLPGPVQNAIIVFAGLAAAIGPIAKLGSATMKAIGALSSALDVVAQRAPAAAAGLANFNTATALKGTAAFAGFTAAGFLWIDMMNKADQEARDWGQSVRDGFDPAKSTYEEALEYGQRLRQGAQDLRDDMSTGLAAYTIDVDYNRVLAGAADEAERAADEHQVLTDRARQLSDELGITGARAWEMVTNQDVMAEATNNAAGEFGVEAAAVAGVAEEIQGFQDALAGLMDPLFGAMTATSNLRDAQQKAREAVAEHGAASREAAAANDEVAMAAYRQESAMLGLAAAVADGSVSAQAAIDQLAVWRDEGMLTEAQFAQQRDRINEVTAAADAVQGRHVAMTVTADTGPAIGSIQRFQGWAGQVLAGMRLPFGIGRSHYGGVAGPTRIGGTPGSEVPIIAQAGEWIVNPNLRGSVGPLDSLTSMSGGGSGTTVVNHYTINAQAFGAREVAREVRDAVAVGSRRGY